MHMPRHMPHMPRRSGVCGGAQWTVRWLVRGSSASERPALIDDRSRRTGSGPACSARRRCSRVVHGERAELAGGQIEHALGLEELGARCGVAVVRVGGGHGERRPRRQSSMVPFWCPRRGGRKAGRVRDKHNSARFV
eukprot:scaffold69472_cov40-Phaeocystis_antarctica.AAC.2